jgi:hypothetical protein
MVVENLCEWQGINPNKSTKLATPMSHQQYWVIDKLTPLPTQTMVTKQ